MVRKMAVYLWMFLFPSYFFLHVWGCLSCIKSYHTTDDQISQNLHHHYPGMGLQSGYSGFSHNKNNHDLWAWRWTCVRRRTAHKDRWCILFAFVSVCGRQKPEYPKLELHGWQRHIQGSMPSGISFLHLYIINKLKLYIN